MQIYRNYSIIAEKSGEILVTFHTEELKIVQAAVFTAGIQ